jgi:hypothetical protein
MHQKNRYSKAPETNESRRGNVLEKWVAKAKSELPMPQDEMEAWLSKLESCLKLPAQKSTTA